jgi:hypothetical protein
MEPSVLVLGIISEEDSIEALPNLDQFIPFLLSLAHNPYSILRSTTLWTLSKYTALILTNEELTSEFIKTVC